jgi:hypothetical protein
MPRIPTDCPSVSARTCRYSLALLAALMVLATVFVPVPAAAASAGWCWDDPVIAVNGQLIDIRVGMPLTHLLTMRSTTLTVIIPQNVFGIVLVDDISLFPMTTRIEATAPPWNGRGAIPVRLVADVQASATYPIQLIATPLANLTTPLAQPVTTYGTANTPLALSLSVGR